MKKRYYYQDGGEVDEEEDVDNDVEEMDETEVEDDSLVFDSTDDGEDNSMDDFDMLDEFPMRDDGYIDFDRFEPTLGNVSHRNAPLKRPVSLLLSDLEKLGINPSSTNTGKHNMGSKHYHGSAFDLGVNTSFGGSIKKMNEFKENFERMKQKNPLYSRFRLVDETVRPKGQKVWSGAHLHIELID